MSTTALINARNYARLLSATQPMAIETDEQHERALAAISGLLRKGEQNLAAEELCLLKLLAILVEDFEKREYPMEEASPRDVLLFFMDQLHLRQRDLLPVFGSRSLVSEVVNGKRGISKSQAKKLANLFHVSTELFI